MPSLQDIIGFLVALVFGLAGIVGIYTIGTWIFGC